VVIHTRKGIPCEESLQQATVTSIAAVVVAAVGGGRASAVAGKGRGRVEGSSRQNLLAELFDVKRLTGALALLLLLSFLFLLPCSCCC
jgi:hypothetical protein